MTVRSDRYYSGPMDRRLGVAVEVKAKESAEFSQSRATLEMLSNGVSKHIEVLEDLRFLTSRPFC